MHLQHRLGPVQPDGGVPPLPGRRLLQQGGQLPQHLPRQGAAPPVEHQGLPLADGLGGPPGHLLRPGEGELGLPVVEPAPVGAGRHRIDQGLVIPEQPPVVQIEVVVAHQLRRSQEGVVDLVHKVQMAYNENLKDLYNKGMLPLFNAGYINMDRQYLTIGVNGLVEAAEALGIEINDNPRYTAFVQEVLGLIERYNKKYRSKEVMFNCEMIPAENVGVKHAKWDREDGYVVPRDCYNSYFYRVEDASLNVIDKFRLHGRKYIEHLTGGSALHMNLEEHLSQEQYRQLLRVAAQEGCNYFTFNIPNTVCNDCGHIDKRYLKACPECQSKNVDYLTRVIGYMKRVSNFSQSRQVEAAKRYYGHA